tara:strand:- start:170 stop:595 length:426 start_codon:yes stop_codon:yes gene_type:complete
MQRRGASTTEELTSLIETDEFVSQNDINSEIINSALCLSNEKIQLKIPLVNKIMTVFGIIIGLLMFARGLLDGRLSMIGLWLRLLYFGVTSGSYALDARLKADRWSFLTPALSGLILTIAQLLGMFVVDGPFECSDLQSCL